MKTWVISDTHFSHAKIIEYENRPFANVEAMDTALIANWNSMVATNDVVYHLGDVCFGNREKIVAILTQLHGTKILVMGNHDRRKTVTMWKTTGFDEVFTEPQVYQGIILSHEPLSPESRGDRINVHGHVHSRTLNEPGYVNLSVELWNYTPVNMTHVLQLCTSERSRAYG